MSHTCASAIITQKSVSIDEPHVSSICLDLHLAIRVFLEIMATDHISAEAPFATAVLPLVSRTLSYGEHQRRFKQAIKHFVNQFIL
jgi:hypothetical protein